MQTEKRKVKAITFIFKEGLSYQNDALPLTVTSWAQARALMLGWAGYAPKNGSYDKLDFIVEWEGGNTYKGTDDLKHWEVEKPDLAKHVRDFLTFLAGTNKPAWMTQEKYDDYIARNGGPDKECVAMLDALSFED